MKEGMSEGRGGERMLLTKIVNKEFGGVLCPIVTTKYEQARADLGCSV
jgi:hypothetical protein